MMNDMENQNIELYEAFLSLCDQFKGIIPPRAFGALIIMFTTKMIYDCAPTHNEAKNVVIESVKSGLEWHKEARK